MRPISQLAMKLWTALRCSLFSVVAAGLWLGLFLLTKDCDSYIKQYSAAIYKDNTAGTWRNGSGPWTEMVYSSYKKFMGPGYILVNEYADQLTGASFSILSLQCWAGSIDSRIRVVEPFLMNGSAFGYNFSDAIWEAPQLSLGDIFDLDQWQTQLISMGIGYSYAAMERWHEFLKLSPRNLIVVYKQCIDPEDDSCYAFFCRNATSFAARNGFRVVRLAQVEDKVYSYENFKNLIYGGLNPRNVVVLFQQWGGLAIKPYRRLYAVFGINRCHRNQYYDFMFESSKIIIQDRKKYAQRYISGERAEYMGVMLRTEKYIYDAMKVKKSPTDKISVLHSCLKSIEEKVSSLQMLHGTKGVFLTVDSRKHGSKGLRNNSAPSFMSNKLLDSFTEKLFQVLEPYGNKLTVNEWDYSFTEVPTFQEPGYVAQLQKDLAVSGKCLVMAGGGSFQRSARIMYLSKHLDSEYCAYNLKCW